MDSGQDYYSFLIPEDQIPRTDTLSEVYVNYLLASCPDVQIFRRDDSFIQEVRGPRECVSKIEYGVRTILDVGGYWPSHGVIAYFWDTELNVEIRAIHDLIMSYEVAVPKTIKWLANEDLTTVMPAIDCIRYERIWRFGSVGVYLRQN